MADGTELKNINCSEMLYITRKLTLIISNESQHCKVAGLWIFKCIWMMYIHIYMINIQITQIVSSLCATVYANITGYDEVKAKQKQTQSIIFILSSYSLSLQWMPYFRTWPTTATGISNTENDKQHTWVSGRRLSCGQMSHRLADKYQQTIGRQTRSSRSQQSPTEICHVNSATPSEWCSTAQFTLGLNTNKIKFIFIYFNLN